MPFAPPAFRFPDNRNYWRRERGDRAGDATQGGRASDRGCNAQRRGERGVNGDEIAGDTREPVALRRSVTGSVSENARSVAREPGILLAQQERSRNGHLCAARSVKRALRAALASFYSSGSSSARQRPRLSVPRWWRRRRRRRRPRRPRCQRLRPRDEEESEYPARGRARKSELPQRHVDGKSRGKVRKVGVMQHRARDTDSRGTGITYLCACWFLAGHLPEIKLALRSARSASLQPSFSLPSV